MYVGFCVVLIVHCLDCTIWLQLNKHTYKASSSFISLYATQS